MSSHTATILVTDLVASTAIRARLGEEEADRLRRLHDQLSRAAVDAHGGMVVKGLGDGILASFAAAADAVAAAVAIQQAADAHTRRCPDLPLVLRMGISSGDVAVEEDGDHFGTPVIEAARLCAAAEEGQILVADLVRLLARGRGGHEFRAVGELELKGFPDPVTAVAVEWVRRGGEGSGGLPFPNLLVTPGNGLGFAGRALELEALTGAWKAAAGGGRRGVFVGGEPGVGKTRLAGEFARRAHEGGGTVLYGRCEEDLGVPYEPFVEALSWFCEQLPGAHLRARLGRFPGELTRLVPHLGEFVPGLDAPLRSDPETEQYRLFEAVSSWLTTAGEPGGLLLVIDDLHWAAPPTLRLLTHVLRADGSARFMVLGTFRDTEVVAAHLLAPILAELRRMAGAERIRLDGLSVDELADLLGDLRKGQAGKALAAALHEGTEGNPFFVGEVLRSQAEDGAVRNGLAVPEGVREVIVSRVGRLSAPIRELLTVASVLGRDLDLAALARVAGVDEDAAIEALDEARDVRLVEETAVGAYRFVHALVRSALYETLSGTRRARLHLRTADVFELDGGEDAARIAHHLVAAGPLPPPGRTAAACLRAGHRALAVLADAEALEWYAQGLGHVTDPDDALRIELLTGLGEAQRRTGDPASRQTLLDAGRLAAHLGDVAGLVRAVLANNRGFTSVIGHVDDERLDLIRVALERVGDEPSTERAELLAVQAAELMFAGDHRHRLRAADEAAAIAAQLGDATTEARVGVRRLSACLVPERTADIAGEGAEVVGRADATGDPQLQVLARSWYVAALHMIGRLEEARCRATEAMAVADDAGQPWLRSMAHTFYATAIDALGAHAEAEDLSQVAYDLGQQAAMPDAAMWYGGRMWMHWTFEGQPETAAAVAAQAFAEFPRMSTWQGAWAVDLALTNQTEQLAEFLAGLPATLPGRSVDLLWLVALFEFAVAQGFGIEDRAAAGAVYELLLPHRALHASYCIGYWGPVEMALGVLARVLGHHDEALAHHDAAASVIDANGAARARVFNDYQRARALLARDAPDDRNRAIGMLEATLGGCSERGYATFEAKTAELLARTALD